MLACRQARQLTACTTSLTPHAAARERFGVVMSSQRGQDEGAWPKPDAGGFHPVSTPTASKMAMMR